jgi:hypothetical protein
MLVFFALHYLLVRPMWRITDNMIAFRADPENPSRIIAESGWQDEIGTAEEELGAMQRACLDAASRAGWRPLASQCRRSTTTCATCWPRHKFFRPTFDLARSQGSAFRPQADACVPERSHLPDNPLLWRRAEPPPERKTIEIEPLIEEVHEALGLGLTFRSGGSWR